ncbi:NYN domain-containing protein [Pseudolabrys taiwanensis]|uniref:NYN domain-containing protein n=1 Tax=Pseudolabrys taiwanensis TaxID=331696 RepID=A0A346A3Q6_9HYPH|nr:NYN domain-containing protein [Pseudolabrys taiwanensis]AXK83803.1 NYN domain-containing protein [Pseudolabrys taiwanensis]
MDGGFIKKKLQQRNKHFPTVAEIEAEVQRIKISPQLAAFSLLRVYFYDAPPASGRLTNPLDGTALDLGSHPHYRANVALQQGLEMQPDFALRQGDTAVHGWALGNAAMQNLAKNGARTLAAADLVPNIEQKGVDLRIGLDIARLSLGKLVDIIVVVTGDSDMVPAFKFARREGVRVYLDHLGHGVKRALKAHVDIVL